MPKTIKNKNKVTITLDKEIIENVKKHNYKLSTLINNLLKNHFSLNSNLSSLGPSKPVIWVRIPVRALNCEISEKSLEYSETLKSQAFNNSNIININSTENKPFIPKNTYFNFKSTYFLYEENFIEFLKNKNLTESYIRDIKNNALKLFSRDIKDHNDLIKEYKNNIKSKKYYYLAIRNLISFWENEEIIPLDILNILKSRIKKDLKENIDSFVPSKDQIDKSLFLIKEIYPKYEIFYKILLESGSRFSEFKEFILNYDPSKIENINNEIVLYRLFISKGTKNSFYLFFTYKTFRELEIILKDLDPNIINSFKNLILRDKNIISLKYLRKYNFTLMIESELSFEIANFIQGRSSKNIGFNHYLAKKSLAIKEYKKILPKLYLF